VPESAIAAMASMAAAMATAMAAMTTAMAAVVAAKVSFTARRTPWLSRALTRSKPDGARRLHAVVSHVAQPNLTTESPKPTNST